MFCVNLVGTCTYNYSDFPYVVPIDNEAQRDGSVVVISCVGLLCKWEESLLCGSFVPFIVRPLMVVFRRRCAGYNSSIPVASQALGRAGLLHLKREMYRFLSDEETTAL